MTSRFRHKLARVALVLFLTFAAAPISGWAQGIIVGPDLGRSEVVLERQSVDASIHDNVAVVTVENVFVNPSRSTAEGIFLFPLPHDAHVSRFSMDIDGRETSGELLSAEEARRIYEEIVRKSLDPAILELVDLRTFRAGIFPIPPGERRTIRLRYDAVLPRTGESVTFNYPLRGTVNAHGIRGPFASTEAVDRPESGHGQLTLSIVGSSPLANIYSPSHEIEVQRQDEHRATVTLALEPLSGHDFVLYYGLNVRAIAATLLAHRPYDDRPGYFMMLLSPRFDTPSTAVQPKDIVFVLDTSGSMAGEKIRQAKDALRYCLERLGERDRFGVVAFNSDVDVMREALQPISARQNARHFVDQLEAGGGTNVNDALLAASRLLQRSDRGMVVFLTDGLPTVGTTNEPTIRKNVSDALPRGVRVYTFGVGYDVNTRLLDGLARDTRALADYISPDENIETRVASFYDRIRYPVFTDLTFEIGGVDAYAYVPRQLEDLHRGDQIIVAGRYRTPGTASITLRGSGLEGAQVLEYTVDLPWREQERDFVARIWATRRVGQLLDEVRANGETDALKEEIIELATEFGLVTPYTSYLVREEDLLTQDEMRLDTPFMGRLRMLSPAAAMSAESGADAVAVSKSIRAMEEASVSPYTPLPKRRYVGGRIMALHGDSVWVDVELMETATPALTVEFASDAYFELLKMYPEAAGFARLGPAVTFQLRGKVVQVSATGRERISAAELQALFE